MMNLALTPPLSQNREQTILVPRADQESAARFIDAAQQAAAAVLQADRAEDQPDEIEFETERPDGRRARSRPAKKKRFAGWGEWPTPDERVRLSDLVAAAKAVAHATIRLCS